MKNPIFPVTFFLGCTLSLLSIQMAYGKVYKLVDESGKTYFADKVTPAEAKLRHETLSKEGMVIDVTEQERTKAQQEQDRKLDVLRAKQDRMIQSQKAHDDALLRTYHSEEEMRAELKEKKRVIETQKGIIESDLLQKLALLDAKQKNAASYERNGKPVSSNLLAEMKKIQLDIAQTKGNIDKNVATQKKLTDEYEANIKRFLMLTQADNATQKNKAPSIEDANTLGLFYCENDYQCKQAWEIALIFVDTHSTTEPDINTDKLVMHASPTKDTDISLSIAKIASKDIEDQLFLDIRCRESLQGKELCASEKIQALRASFRPYVNERLNSKVPTP